MKKLLVWLLILAMTVCVLASCIRGGDELPDNDNSKETEKDFGTKPDIDTDKETDADLETEADTDTETDIDTDTDTDIDTDTEAETETETEIESETESKTETETDKETETGSETETEIPDGISFNTLDVNGTEVYGKVSNDTTEFSFANELTTSGKATYAVSLDQYGIQTVITKTIPLDAGDNTVYVIEDIDGAITVYTVTIRRRPMYTVSFDTNGGTAVESQIVEEDSLASEPTTEREGYTFVRWEFDFESPITDNVEITSVWRSNVYTVTYDTSGGSAVSDATLTYGESYMLPEPTKADCTFVGWYDGDAIVQQSGVWSIANNVTLTAKWSATVNVSADSSALACSGGGVYDCDTEVTISVVSDSPLLSEGFIGWYDANDNLLSRDEEYTFTLTGNIEIIAKYGTFPELANFVYTSTSTTCKITGVIDSSVTTIVVPDFVTEIELGAFSECTHVQSLTLPFVGATKDGTSNTHLAYIFGASSYEDGNYVSSYLTHIKITGGTSIGDYAFYKGYSYTRIELPDSIETIGEYAFYYCYNLRNVSLPDNVKSIEKYAFAYCERFTSIDLPNGLETIGGSPPIRSRLPVSR